MPGRDPGVQSGVPAWWSAAHGGMDERRARPIIRGTVVLLLCAERGGLARASSLLAGTVFFLLLLYSFARFLFIRLIKERPALILRLAADDDSSCVPSAGKPACMQLGGRPFPSIHHRPRDRPHENAVIVFGLAAWGKVYTRGTNVRALRLRKCMSPLSRQSTHYYVRTLIHKNDARLRFPTRNACRRICRRVRSDPRRHAQTMLHGSFPRHLTGRSMPSGID